MTTREANPNTDRRDEKETTSLRAAVRKDNQQCNSSQGTSDTPGNGWDDDRVDVAERARHHYRHHTENITSLASDVRTRTVQPPTTMTIVQIWRPCEPYAERMSHVHNVDDSEDGHGDCAQYAKRMPAHAQLPLTYLGKEQRPDELASSWLGEPSEPPTT